MITQLSIRHFKAIASATIPLGPITVLVGPNDSGKSTILQALMALSRCGDPARFNAEQLLECSASVVATHGGAAANGSAAANGGTTTNIELAADGIATLGSKKDKESKYRYMTSLSQSNVFAREKIEWEGQEVLSAVFGGPMTTINPSDRVEKWAGTNTELSITANEPYSYRGAPLKVRATAIADDLKATLLRLDARAIAKPSALDAPVLPDGSGLVGIVDEWLTSGIDDDRTRRVNELLRRLSPHVMKMATKKHSASDKELHFVLQSGVVIPASQMSDGVVIAAALAVISHRSGNHRLLIEEPENGLHPRQLKVVADTIRSIAETQDTQIILTTHSPLLLNHFAAEEVLLVIRDQAGVRVQRMSEARGLDDLASEMALGELWYNVGDSNLAQPA